MFDAILIEKTEGGSHPALARLDDARLHEGAQGDVTVRVEWSTLNYKDGLALTGRSPVVRKFPMVAGIDFAGVVEDSAHPDWRAGDRVLVNGWGLGETHWGGLAGKARVRGDWLVRVPERFSTRDAMAIGTAGYTSMLCVLAIERLGGTPDRGDALVTGANGGVGSLAVALLAKRGWRVVASTGRVQEADHLRALGAAEVVDRAELSAPGRPLGKERWAAVVDSVGSHTLANACAQVKYGGVVAACGLAQGLDFPASVAPFILRGVTLAGIDSVMAPIALRRQAWARLAEDLPDGVLQANTREIGMDQVIDTARALLDGRVRGRVVVKVA